MGGICLSKLLYADGVVVTVSNKKMYIQKKVKYFRKMMLQMGHVFKCQEDTNLTC